MAVGKKRICIPDHILFPLMLVAALPISPAFLNLAKGKNKTKQQKTKTTQKLTTDEPCEKMSTIQKEIVQQT